ncbi:MAG TPA: hypothetical protein VMS11_09765 [Solirubrobacterales bacterium]|nr:hypothetical protein [Solirubrobacterales bacterium]
MTRSARLAAHGLLAAMLCSLALAHSVHAAYEPLGSATTTLSLAPAFSKFLKEDGIKLTALVPAKAKGANLSLPLAEGKWDPTTGKGQIESEGAIVFEGKRWKLPFRNLMVKANSNPLTAKVGGGQLKVAACKEISAKRAGFGSLFQAKALRLSAKTATRLNKKLRPQAPFKANQLLGTLKAASAPEVMSVLARNRATLAISPGFAAKLKGLFVSLNPIAPAEIAPGPTLSFPIGADSTISPDGTKGQIRTTGEAELLLLGSGQVFWANQWLDLGAGSDLVEANLQPAPPFGGKQAQAPLFSLSPAGAQVVPDPQGRSVSVQGAALALTQAAADQLDQLLAGGKPTFVAGEALGSVSATLQGQ